MPRWRRKFFNTATVAYSGEDDKQIQAATSGAFLTGEGLTLRHVIGPKTGHKYHPTAKAEIDERINAIAARGQDAVPSEVRLVTARCVTTGRRGCRSMVSRNTGYRHASGRVDWQPAHRGQHDQRLAPRFVDALRRLPLRPNGNPTVIIDGQQLIGDRVARSLVGISLHQGAGQWRPVGRFEFAGLAKRPGLQGPIDDAFMDRFVMVKPTGEALTEASGNWVSAQLGQALSDWELQFRAKPRVIDDIELSEEDIRENNLILRGNPPVIRRLQKT